MQCYNPILLTQNNWYRKDGRMIRYDSDFLAPCGKCLACLSQKSREWTMRLSHEWSYYNEHNSLFITLTYDKENVPQDYSLHKRDVQLFYKRLRKQLDKEQIKIKHLTAGEYGFKKGRPHYHAIVFGVPNISTRLIRDVNQYSYDYKISNQFKFSKYDRLVYKCWRKGNVRIGYVSNKSIQYCSQYTLKEYFHSPLNRREYFKKYGREKPFRLLSKGIGKRYALENKMNIMANLRINYQGKNISIPRSYLNWIERSGIDIRQAIKEQTMERVDKEIQDLYKEFGIQPKLWTDFYNFEDYFKLYKHHRLWRILENRNIRKQYQYMKRHQDYMEKKMSMTVMEESIA